MFFDQLLGGEVIQQNLMSLIPEIEELLPLRLKILELLSHESGPIGRKLLAQKMSLSERSLRTQLDVLRAKELIEVTHSGIHLGGPGRLVLEDLTRDYVLHRESGDKIQQALKEELGLATCYLVEGESQDPKDLAKGFALAVIDILNRETSSAIDVAVTGGTTLANLAHYLTSDLTSQREVTFISSRGGVPGDVHIQSNTVAGLMAQATGGYYLPLYLPDSMPEKAYQEVLQDPAIQETLTRSQRADAILLSIGSAQAMAQRRQLSPEHQALIRQKKAVGEAFGSFFNQEGDIIFSLPRIGVQLEDLQRFPLILIIVAGENKAIATRGFYNMLKQWDLQTILICDENLANHVLNGVTQLNN